jgi:hypothetical protein
LTKGPAQSRAFFIFSTKFNAPIGSFALSFDAAVPLEFSSGDS